MPLVSVADARHLDVRWHSFSLFIKTDKQPGDPRYDDMLSTLALAGDEVGAPILSIASEAGERLAFQGPVLSRLPSGEERLRMWDAVAGLLTIDSLWEMKRVRTEGPRFDTI